MRRATPRRWRCGASIRWACAAAVLLVAAAPAPAAAQSTLTGGRGTLLVPDADTVPPTHFTTSFGAGYTGGLPDRFEPAPVGVTFGFWNDLDVGLGLRSWSKGDPEAHGASVDPQLALKLRLVREAPGRPALAVALAIDHPFQGLDLSPSVILHRNQGPLLLTGELGWRLPLRSGAGNAAAPFAGVGAAYWLSAGTSFFAQALGEGGREARMWLMPGVAFSLLGPDPFEKRREALRAQAKAAVAALEAELGTRVDAVPEKAELSAIPASALNLGGRVARLAAPGRVTFFVTGGPAFGAGPGWRVLAGIQISSFDEFLQDSDGDGIPDRVDRCPFEPEDWDGYEDGDGCPDHGTEVLRKLALDRLAAAAAQGPKLTSPFPRFRLRIPVGEVPNRDLAPRDLAPMYRPLDAPPPSPAPAPATPRGAAPPGAAKPPPVSATKAKRGDHSPADENVAASPAPFTARPAVISAPAPRPAVGSAPLRSLSAAPAVVPAAVASLLSAPAARRRVLTAGSAAVEEDVPVTVAVMVLPPVSIVKRPPPLVQVRLRGAAGRAGPSLGVERELTALAFARFQGPDRPLSDQDRESIEAVIRAAGAEGGELLVWARAREPALLPEAARRADEIIALAARQGAPATTRVTTSQETAAAVEVQVSATAYRVRLPYAAAPEPDEPRREQDPSPLESGDASRSQLRRTALTHRGEIERCLSLAAGGLGDDPAEVVVRIAVEPDGSAVVALRNDSPLWRPSVDACLATEARTWRFPFAEGRYVFDLPVNVTPGGGRP